MNAPEELNLAQALQRAFIEAGSPSVSAAATGSGVSRQRLSDWRSGRHVPSRFEDLEPAIAYLRLTADGAAPGTSDAGVGAVTGWTPNQWRQAWERSTPIEVSVIDRVAEVDRRPLAIAVMSLLVFLVAALAVMAFFLSMAYR
ncbi:hypothetical protein [Tsukamurella pseudospumae]|uniref:Uncharacterized protein n=1 Tax=Tsukamurella pseudospumae TaxID=239498 RepID=A0A138AE39_9ACTN|nr:hypothetical protein [Tsukamurella pseudospumae]KXP08723.1 hypothetical protein AXK60_08595 [Tsukamurella pseudospumae]